MIPCKRELVEAQVNKSMFKGTKISGVVRRILTTVTSSLCASTVTLTGSVNINQAWWTVDPQGESFLSQYY